jgi:hypothetical protein
MMTEILDDAKMIVELARWGTEMGLEDALAKLFQPNFDPTSANDDDPSVRKVLWFYETVGTLVKRGALSGDFVKDVWWVEGMWPLVEPHVLAAREGSGEARLYENFEALATK